MISSHVEALDLSAGAFLNAGGTCTWRVWAPKATDVQLTLLDDAGKKTCHPMTAGARGWRSCQIEGIAEGQRYFYRLDGEREFPDPASRWQPDGPHAASAVWSPDRFEWSDPGWRGVPLPDLVIYELHVGTFTEEGSFAAIEARLDALVELGITAIELMPLAQFPGHRNWGYDGTYWYAVQNSYGGPRALQRLIDVCHRKGLAVILDVIYNHLGPEGNYLGAYGHYFTTKYQTPWGSALNYDDRGCDTVRDFVYDNVRQWFRDFHVDGLRLDAVHSIFDMSPRSVLAEIKLVADEEGARRGWPAVIIAESNLNDVRLLDPAERGGFSHDAQWNDDFHHVVHSLLTGERDGYYADFDRPPEQLVKALNDVFVYDGVYSPYRQRRHGAPAGDLPGRHFVVSIQTHDQVGNRACGERLTSLVGPPQLRLAAALELLSPFTPMLFMGEEYGESNPFPFFCDFGDEELREAVRRGRRDEFADFAWAGEVPDPQDEATFRSAVLTWSWPEGSWNAGLRRLYQELLALRRRWPALADDRHRSARLLPASEGSALVELVRGDPSRPQDLLVALFNCGPVACPAPVSETPPGTILLRTESARFGGTVSSDEPTGDAALGAVMAPFECLVLKPSGENRE